MEPSLNTTSVGRINELFEVRCSGYIGRDEEGNAASKLHFETKTGVFLYEYIYILWIIYEYTYIEQDLSQVVVLAQQLNYLCL